MDAALAGLIGAGIGAGGGILTTLFSGRSERRSQQISWRRDQRVAAYGAVLEASHRHYGCVVRAWQSEEHDRDLAAIGRESTAAKFDLYRAKATVAIVGPPQARAAADRLIDAHEALVDAVGASDHVLARDVPPHGIEHLPAKVQLEEASNAFIAAAQSALE